VVEDLAKRHIGAEAIHGNKSQSARQKALENFRAGRIRVLVATDIAARGIDIDGITHVINYDLPNVPESYVHRIGRTARAGADGIAISFCDSEERAFLRDIEKLIKQRVPVVTGHAFPPGQGGAAEVLVAEPRNGQRQRSGRPSNHPSSQRRSAPARQGHGHAHGHAERPQSHAPRAQQTVPAGRSLGRG
jgi:ATP-dependent RNA helicase RhlE